MIKKTTSLIVLALIAITLASCVNRYIPVPIPGPDDTPIVTPSGDYTVIFNGNGGTWTDGTVFTTYADEGTAISTIAPTTTPARDGYTFLGWGATATASEVTTETSITANTTLYAIWGRKVFDLNYPADNDAFMLSKTINAEDLIVPEHAVLRDPAWTEGLTLTYNDGTTTLTFPSRGG